MTPFTISARERKIVPWLILATGVLVTAGALLGVWLQGPFYLAGFPTPTTFGEVRLAFTAAAMTLGTFLVSRVLFARTFPSSLERCASGHDAYTAQRWPTHDHRQHNL
jgi:hypothetical protein